jgi:hypothetical protein
LLLAFLLLLVYAPTLALQAFMLMLASILLLEFMDLLA